MKDSLLQNNLDGWTKHKLSLIGVFSKGAGIAKDQLSETGHNAVRYGELYTHFNIKIKKIYSHIPNSIIPATKKIKYGDILFAGSGETNDEIGKSAVYLLREDGFASGDTIIFSPKNANSLFLAHFLNVGIARKKLRELGQGQSVVHIYKSDIENLEFCLPSEMEQNRIVSVIETWDSAIEKLGEKIEIKKRIKKGLMRELLTGKTRLPGFSGEWETKEIGELLDYERPDKYIVKETNYDNAHKTPVLTANKSFILGYTNETSGIYKNLPAIIFDDFTVDNKFVDFPFKIKSSAIKILKQKSDKVNIWFVFERMQLINFAVGQHKRNYISEYQYFAVDMPDIQEQNAIAKILITANDEIVGLERKLSFLKDQKKFLLNNLITGVIRVPEGV